MKLTKNIILFAAALLCNFCLSQAADIKEGMLLALQQDQQHRSQLNTLKNQQQNVGLIKQLEQAQNNLDQDNLKFLDQVINQLGHWPGINDVGENAAKIGLILFKRSDLNRQASYLPLIYTEVQNHNIPATWYSELYDHHLMMKNLPQNFGHLLVKSTHSEQQFLYPIQSIEQVNKNRKILGLTPLKEMLGTKNWLLRAKGEVNRNHELVPAEQLMQIADLALTCLDQIYPNSIKHILNHADDAAVPDQLYPAFFGCFDWHSSVHGHWLLVRAAKLFPNHEKTPVFIERLAAHFTAEKLKSELDYFQQSGRAGFERPYGLAWFLQLYAEIHDWQHPSAQAWLLNMQPLKNHIVQQLTSWVPKLAYPIRSGEHSQTAFAFGLAYDYAKITEDHVFSDLLEQQVNRLYLDDRKCPINYEPSGHDFLSPCLAEADLMRRVLSQQDYSKWLKRFLPGIKKGSRWLKIAQVTDRVDGKLAHLDGLNIARAWMLEGMAFALPKKDKRQQLLLKLADKHAESGLAAVTGEHYSGGHWLGSFATYYLTQSGLN
ncbi:DUF2891 domain-containing protein [Marinicella litoralis]|uniref:DUF2891 family protein n=1 Tax=Marinicella litoralis TaxID=644220 RepID=A0A4R6XS79_9GAMM|nr:DUF2891 domain-containing protein [Marinicella litoralis]TDR22616.1 hypothetical protein C8D91_1108 [Marinicella litoralis]